MGEDSKDLVVVYQSLDRHRTAVLHLQRNFCSGAVSGKLDERAEVDNKGYTGLRPHY